LILHNLGSNSEYRFGIAKIKIVDKQVEEKVVDLPSKDYIFSVDKDDVGIVQHSGLFRSLNVISSVFVRANNTEMEENNADNIVHVVAPDVLEIDIFDVTGKFDANDHQSFNNLLNIPSGKFTY
jgi:hypothetical protein